jgi:dipeptidyl aminopeptidase/acylaminoacyl peptidase
MMKSPLKTLIKALAVSALAVAIALPASGQTGPASHWRPSTPPLALEAGIDDWDLRGVVMSPDGKHVAGITKGVNGGPPRILVWNTENLGAEPKVLGSARMRFAGVTFLSNDRLLVTAIQPVSAGSGSDWFGKILITDLEGRNWLEPLKEAFEERQTAVASFFARIPGDDQHVLMQYGELFQGQDVVKMNIYTGVGQRVARNGDDAGFAANVGPDGTLRVRQTVKVENGDYIFKTFFRQTEAEPWRELKALEDRASLRVDKAIVRINREGTRLWFRTNEGRETSVIKMMDLRTGEVTPEPVFQNPEFNASRIVWWSPDTNDADNNPQAPEPVIGGYCYAGPSEECVYTDPRLNELQGRLERHFRRTYPGVFVNIQQIRNGGNLVLVRITAPHVPDRWFTYRVQDGRPAITQIGTVSASIEPRNLATAQWVTYKARDGLDIPAIVYLPPGYDAARDGRLPLVVMPHGGPWARDDMDFDISMWPQLFATRGFAVLLPQYRGSADLTATLWRSGDNEWGGKMQDDKDDGARWLVEQGVADPNRMMMYGYSYGGFAAAAAAARSGSLSKGLWQCAISGAPAIDLTRIGTDWGESRFQRLIQGRTVGGRDPYDHLEEVEIPWLIFHGSYDRQADTIHSRTTAARMRQVNNRPDFRYVEIPEMAHTLVEMTPDQRRQFIPLMFNWLDENCGNISAGFSDPEAKAMMQSLGLPQNRRGRRG